MKNNTPLVSVIIPVFNTEKYLKECLDSVFNQTYKNIEVIIINDCSTDGSLNIISDFRNKYKNIIFINNKHNLGLSTSRNNGIDMSNGDYISFVDSDDILHKDFINYMIQNVLDNNCDMGISDYTSFESLIIDNDKNGKKKANGYIVNQNDIWKITSEADLIKKTVSWGKIYERNIFRTCRYRKGKIHEDEYIFHHIYSQIKSVFITNKCLYYYRKRPFSIMQSETINSFADKIYSICERVSFIKKNDIQDKGKIILYYLNMLTGYPIYGTFTLEGKMSLYYLNALRKLGKEFWYIKGGEWEGKIWFWRCMCFFPYLCYRSYKNKYAREVNK